MISKKVKLNTQIDAKIKIELIFEVSLTSHITYLTSN